MALADHLLTNQSQLYFIRAGDFVKIGRTTNLEARLVSIQTGCPFKIGEVIAIDGAGKNERSIHWRLSKHRTHGEWFQDLRATWKRVSFDVD